MVYVIVSFLLDCDNFGARAPGVERSLDHKPGRPNCVRDWTSTSADLEEVESGLVVLE